MKSRSLPFIMRFAFHSAELLSLTEGWMLTDVANSTELGTTERVRAKEKLVEEKFIQEIERIVAENGNIARKLANFIFVGPTGSGKSSLMDCLLRRAKKELSLSTGVCDPVVMVDVNFHSATAVDSDTWEEVEYDLSLLRQMNQEGYVTPPTNELQQRPSEEMGRQATELASSSTPTSTPEPAKPHKHVLSRPKQSQMVRARSTISSTSSLYNVRVNDTILSVIKRHGGPKSLMNYLRKGVSLYLRDTGGQAEFQEMIALLIIGPSIFLFVFRIDQDFQGKFSVEYRVSENESTNCYTSSITTEEALLQCLSSVYAMGTLGDSGVKTHKPFVIIVGTHKDKLGPSAEVRIAELNKHLESLIKKNGFLDLVQYADFSKGQVMFAVNNTAESDEDFKAIRSQVHSLISGREEFTIEYPITYLLFCLELQNVKRSVLTLDECKVMAAKYGIVGDQVSHLLQFLHLRIGVIHYYNEDGLRHIVVKEPQVLFNRVTNLIIRTFSCKALTTKEQRDFQKGILTASALGSVVTSSDHLTCEDFLKLLVYLRIITPFPLITPGDQEARYFIPCVLNHVQESGENLHTDILPLSVQFRCSHCPKGLFGVLVTHLMTPVPDQQPISHTSFMLMEDKIFKDQVSFIVSSYSDRDEVSLKMLTSRIDVGFFPSLCEARDQSVGEVCSNVRQVIEASILRALDNLHYDKHKVKPMMCFRCEHCSEFHEVNRGKNHHKIFCEKTHQNSRIPLLGRCWYNEGKDYYIQLGCRALTQILPF